MSYFVKICSKCKTANNPSMTFCGKCGADLPSEKTESETKPIQPPAYAVQSARAAQQYEESAAVGGGPEVATSSGPIACKVVDVDMPFWSMVTFLVKFAMASIPALIIVTVYMAFALAILAAIGYGIR